MVPGSGFWMCLRSLKILNLHDNPIGRLENLSNLSSCPSLTALTLYDTPLSLKKNYRFTTVCLIFNCSVKQTNLPLFVATWHMVWLAVMWRYTKHIWNIFTCMWLYQVCCWLSTDFPCLQTSCCQQYMVSESFRPPRNKWWRNYWRRWLRRKVWSVQISGIFILFIKPKVILIYSFDQFKFGINKPGHIVQRSLNKCTLDFILFQVRYVQPFVSRQPVSGCRRGRTARMIMMVVYVWFIACCMFMCCMLILWVSPNAMYANLLYIRRQLTCCPHGT